MSEKSSVSDLLALENTVRALFDESVGVSVVGIGDPAAVGTAVEISALGQVVDKRKAEFIAGRHAARGALGGIGLPTADILIGTHRQPLPPQGAVLTISHDQRLAMAVAAPAEKWLGLGVDIADADELAENLIATICGESDLLNLQQGESIAGRAKLVFCLKEALFKAIFPQVLDWMDFSQSALSVDHASASYQAHFYGADGAKLLLQGQWHGRFARVGNRWIAVAGLRRVSA